MIAAVGTFDGVHAGHRFLIDRLTDEARLRGLTPAVVTFDRHPLELVRPDAVPPAITSPQEQQELLEQLGVRVIRLPFTPGLRALTGSEFAAMLRRDYGVKALMLGFNNHIGSDRSTAPEAHGVEVVHCRALPDRADASSSAIRALITDGRIEEANELLGHPFTLRGTVVRGKQLGRTLGFPTANLEPEPRSLTPATGVYAGRALGHPAVVNVGHRPTVDAAGSPLSVEVHITGYHGDLYGRPLRVELLRRLRPERRFGSLDELKQAIAHDINQTLSTAYGPECHT